MSSNDEQIEAAYQDAIDKGWSHPTKEGVITHPVDGGEFERAASAAMEEVKEEEKKASKDAREQALTDQEWQDLYKQAQVDVEALMKVNTEEEKNRRRKRGLYGHEDAGAVALELMDELAEKAGDWAGAGRVELRRSSKMVLRGGHVDGVAYYPPNYEVAYRPNNWKEVSAANVRFFVEIADRYNCHMVFKSRQDENIEAVFRGRAGYNG